MKNIATSIRFLSLVNFFSFFLGAIYLGGDAVNGKTEAGQYFLSWHGHFTQVSEAIFRYSYIHVMSVFVVMTLTLIVSLLSKPSPEEIKWLNRTVGLLGGLSAAYALVRFG
ncbi:hypothetical protein EON83_30370 [bacterium]|nr:MAG: hypothetical protein EON83_30370 [bacterium]